MVAVVAFDGVQLLDVTGPAEVLTTANGFGARYAVRVVSPSGADVRTSSGVRIGVDGALESLPARLGTVVVPGRRDWRRAVADQDLIALVTELSRRSARVTSVCAGAFVLAQTGVLDGRRAATHWRLAAQLAAAQALLDAGNNPVEKVAEESGFGSAETMRRVFQHTLGVAPTTYRARFRTTAAAVTRAGMPGHLVS